MPVADPSNAPKLVDTRLRPMGGAMEESTFKEVATLGSTMKPDMM